MITSVQQKPDPSAVLIVYGRDISGIPRASWFKAEDKADAIAAAQSMKLATLELKTDEEKALTIGIHEGVLKGSGRMIVGSASPEAFGRIEDHARKMKSGAAATKVNEGAAANQPIAPSPHSASGPSSAAPPSGAAPSPTATSTASAPSAAPTSPWASLRVGSTVLAAYWNEEKEIEGWWPAVITRADDNEFRLRWRDTTEYALGKVEPKHIAILHPEFLASGTPSPNPHPIPSEHRETRP
jgi:hypothetical protein